MVISSPHNPQLKEIRKLQSRSTRTRTCRFIAEGEDLLQAADEAGWTPEATFATENDRTEATLVTADALAKVSTLGSGTRAVGIYKQRWNRVKGPFCLTLWGVRDPGNVGTAIRSAVAFGVSSVAIGPDCADPYSPKAVRASMGAIFAVDLAQVKQIRELPGTKIALVAHGGEQLESVTPPKESTIIVGSERIGLAANVITECDQRATISVANESLNAAMAATIALYALGRKRQSLKTN